MNSYFTTKVFFKSLQKMTRDRGRNSRAIREVNELIGLITRSEPNPFKTFNPTNHGETRIDKCTKYDLHDFCRLVTVQDGYGVTMLYVGDHDDVDRWLDSNRGLVIAYNNRSKMLQQTYASGSGKEDQINNGHDKWTGKLINRLSEQNFDLILGDIKTSLVKPILNIDAGSRDDEIEYAASSIHDETLRQTVIDVLILLNKGQLEEAEQRVAYHAGSLKPLEDLSPEEMIEVGESSEIKRVPIGSEEYQIWVNSFINSEQPFDWLLFMHPEQEEFVKADYTGPAQLSGVSGSGKTTIAIMRAIRLAQKFDGEKILVVTLNKALADLISQILDFACSESLSKLRINIDVRCYFDLAQELIFQLEPENKSLFTNITWQLEEHKDEIFREFYRCMYNNYSAKVLLDTHIHLAAQNIDAEKYISEEFDWIRSVFTKSRQGEYLEIERKGRGFPLATPHRKNILAGLEAWEQKMRDVGVIDNLGLTMAVGAHFHKIVPRYRSIIVDEAQDFGTTELQILRQIVSENANDLLLCGDAAQQVQPKQQDFKKADIIVGNRKYSINKNYRNSREILEVAYQILVENLSVEHLDNSELEISDPRFATRSSPKPVLLEGATLGEEIAAALKLMQENAEAAQQAKRSHNGCIVIAGYTQFEVEKFGKEVELNVLNGEKQFFGGEIFLSDLEQTKGYEFDTLIIVNCRANVLPPNGVPREELYRFVSQFYVAMTRAKSQLVLSYSGTPSDWLTNTKVKLENERWDQYLDTEELKYLGIPKFLPEFPGEDALSISELSGLQFIYTDDANGMQPDLLQKISACIPSGVVSDFEKLPSNRIYANLGDVYNNMIGAESGRPKTIFGNIFDKSFMEIYLNALDPLNKKLHMNTNENNISHAKTEITDVKIAVPIKARSTRQKNPKNKVVEDSLRSLNLKPRDHAILHSIGLRTLQDVVIVEHRKLQGQMPKKQISEIKKLARSKLKQISTTSDQALAEVSMLIPIAEINFSKRTSGVLKQHNVKFVSDLKNLDLGQLKKNPTIGKQQLLEVQRLAFDYGIKLNLN